MFRRGRAPRGDGLRALVHVERGANAVAGPVAVVEAHRPERRARERVQRQPGRAGGEHRAVQCDVALRGAWQVCLGFQGWRARAHTQRQAGRAGHELRAVCHIF